MAVVTPTLGPAIEAVYATGIVEAIDTARVGTTVAGRVVAVLVWEGDVVRQGQPLAQLDDREARQALEDARARLALAEQELARDRVLVATGVHTVQALQRSVAERDRASAAVELAARQVDDRRIVAPLDGIVMRREVDPGNTAAAATALFTVASTARLRIAADVDERDIAAVRMGARVAIRADAYPNEAFTAVVTNIRHQGDTATRTFRVEADLPPPTWLFIGMTVDVNIVVAERPDALLLPPGALRHDPPQGGRPGPAYVFRVQDDLARRVPVETGAEGAAAIEIRSGVARNDQVIVDPPENLAGTAPGYGWPSIPLALAIALAHLRARKRQTLVSVLGVTLGVGVFIAIGDDAGVPALLPQIIETNPHIMITDEIRQPAPQPLQLLHPRAAVAIRRILPRDPVRGIAGAGAILVALDASLSRPGGGADPARPGHPAARRARLRC